MYNEGGHVVNEEYGFAFAKWVDNEGATWSKAIAREDFRLRARNVSIKAQHDATWHTDRVAGVMNGIVARGSLSIGTGAEPDTILARKWAADADIHQLLVAESHLRGAREALAEAEALPSKAAFWRHALYHVTAQGVLASLIAYGDNAAAMMGEFYPMSVKFTATEQPDGSATGDIDVEDGGVGSIAGQATYYGLLAYDAKLMAAYAGPIAMAVALTVMIYMNERGRKKAEEQQEAFTEALKRFLTQRALEPAAAIELWITLATDVAKEFAEATKSIQSQLNQFEQTWKEMYAAAVTRLKQARWDEVAPHARTLATTSQATVLRARLFEVLSTTAREVVSIRFELLRQIHALVDAPLSPKSLTAFEVYRDTLSEAEQALRYLRNNSLFASIQDPLVRILAEVDSQRKTADFVRTSLECGIRPERPFQAFVNPEQHQTLLNVEDASLSLLTCGQLQKKTAVALIGVGANYVVAAVPSTTQPWPGIRLGVYFDLGAPSGIEGSPSGSRELHYDRRLGNPDGLSINIVLGSNRDGAMAHGTRSATYNVDEFKKNLASRHQEMQAANAALDRSLGEWMKAAADRRREQVAQIQPLGDAARSARVSVEQALEAGFRAEMERFVVEPFSPGRAGVTLRDNDLSGQVYNPPSAGNAPASGPHVSVLGPRAVEAVPRALPSILRPTTMSATRIRDKAKESLESTIRLRKPPTGWDLATWKERVRDRSYHLGTLLDPDGVAMERLAPDELQALADQYIDELDGLIQFGAGRSDAPPSPTLGVPAAATQLNDLTRHVKNWKIEAKRWEVPYACSIYLSLAASKVWGIDDFISADTQARKDAGLTDDRLGFANDMVAYLETASNKVHSKRTGWTKLGNANSRQVLQLAAHYTSLGYLVIYGKLVGQIGTKGGHVAIGVAGPWGAYTKKPEWKGLPLPLVSSFFAGKSQVAHNEKITSAYSSPEGVRVYIHPPKPR